MSLLLGLLLPVLLIFGVVKHVVRWTAGAFGLVYRRNEGGEEEQLERLWREGEDCKQNKLA
jgi:hypothetical protein